MPNRDPLPTHQADLIRVQTEVAQQQEAIDRLERLLFIGNGREPITVVLGALEERIVTLERRSDARPTPTRPPKSQRDVVLIATSVVSAISAIVCAWLTGGTK